MQAACRRRRACTRLAGDGGLLPSQKHDADVRHFANDETNLVPSRWRNGSFCGCCRLRILKHDFCDQTGCGCVNELDGARDALGVTNQLHRRKLSLAVLSLIHI